MGAPRREIILPPRGVDEKRIVKREALAEVFEMHLCPAAFEAVAAGKKTVELRQNDEKRKCICRGDFIDFLCGEKRCRVRVTKAETFENFDALFRTEQASYETDRAYSHRQSLVRRARFEGYKTPQALYDFLRSIYPENTEKRGSALALSIKLV